jgi:hypothetical protein
MQTDPEIVVFTIGYHGWGGATDRLVQLVDAVEDARGFAAPFFVDLRFSRAVRAKGFTGRHFEQLVGSDRYCHIPGLGNENALLQRSNPELPTRIARPDQADQLLQLVSRSAAQRRRVICFCHCRWPIDPSQARSCHRVDVATLVLGAASRRDASISLVEWPGTPPEPLSLAVNAEQLKKVAAGHLKSIVLPDHPVPARFGAIGWGSVLTLSAGDRSLSCLVGPARFEVGKWVLPILHEVGAAVTRQDSEVFRQRHGLGPRSGVDFGL